MKSTTAISYCFLMALSLATPVEADSHKDLPDVQYYGYKIVHHIRLVNL